MQNCFYPILEFIQAKDKRYRRLVQKQKIIYICTVAVMFLSAGVAVSGYFRMDAEKQKKYELLVRQEAECISASDFDNFEIVLSGSDKFKAQGAGSVLSESAGSLSAEAVR